jgi:hypothetical protein
MSGAKLLLLGAVQQAVASDPYFENTTLLLPGNGTNGAQNNTFLDSSTNAFSITRNGNTTQGTFSPFSQTGWGNYFGGSGNYLTAPNNTATDLGYGDFTIEAWVNTTAATAYQMIVQKYGSPGANNGYTFRFDSTGTKLELALFNGSTGATITGSAIINDGRWHHVAAVRTGSTVSLYVDGARDATATNTYNVSSTSAVYIAQHYNGAFVYVGYISNLRIIKGSGPYDAALTTLTVPVSPLTAITNTSLLTCQSNRFIDNSTNAFAITATGSPSVQAFSPFNPTAAWSATTYGGSGYFDGSGDYLTVADNAAFEMTADFTIEAWFYLNTLPGAGDFADIVTKGAAAIYQPYYIFVNPSGSLLFYSSSTGSSWDVASGVSFGTVTTGQWYHVAVSRSGTSLRMFLNGALINTITNGNALYDNNRAVTVGARSDGTEDKLKGYICDVRLVKGTAVYTAAFTPPTAPLTAITNTSLLLNFTNAGIYDATSKNDLETVGNAQISTTQSKFGGSSMYFDGSGDYLQRVNSPILSLDGDFTIEGWIYINAYTAGSPTFFQLGSSTGALLIYVSSADGNIKTAGTFALTGGNIGTGTWKHFALVRYGTGANNVTFYVNGIASGQTTNTSSLYGNASNGLRIGAEYPSAFYLDGYIDDLRITKGIARYTSNFTSPTTAFPLL